MNNQPPNTRYPGDNSLLQERCGLVGPSERMRWIRRLKAYVSIGCLLLVVSSCQSKSACIRNGVSVDIVGNHGHEVAIATDHVNRGVGGLYPVRGGTHEHTMMLTDADMKALQSGKAVTTRTTSVGGHVHEVNVTCKD